MLSRWDPFEDMLAFQRQMSQFARRMFGDGTTEGTQQRFAPPVDVFSRGNDLVVRAELPGIDPEKDVDITVQDRMLRIHGERRQEQRTERDQYLRVESSYGMFERSIPLPESVSEDDIKASYENGILEVVVPKAAETTGGAAKKIPITSGGQQKSIGSGRAA